VGGRDVIVGGMVDVGHSVDEAVGEGVSVMVGVAGVSVGVAVKVGVADIVTGVIVGVVGVMLGRSEVAVGLGGTCVKVGLGGISVKVAVGCWLGVTEGVGV
jgi:hypothetical protein